MFVAVIPLAGRALDRFGSRAVLMAGAAITALGLALFAASLESLWLAVGSIALAGVGFGALLGAPTRYIITNEVPPDSRATAVGLLSVFLIIGQIFGGSLAGGTVGARIDDVAAYRLAYDVFAAVALLATLGTFFLASRAAERKTPVAVSA
jgi:MFS family permease